MFEMMKKMLGHFNVRKHSRCIGGMAVAALCITALTPQSVRADLGYSVLKNNRVLLMNNDSKGRGAAQKITLQSYYDTNETEKTYWVHSGEAGFSRGNRKALLVGSEHVLWQNDGNRTNKLWELKDCRAGSATVISSDRNYIPWTATAQSITDGTTSGIAIPDSGNVVAEVGSVILRNSLNAVVYSPVYTDGIGTIYFDAVNPSVEYLDIKLDVQIATNMLEGASNDIATADNEDEFINWQNVPLTVFSVTGARSLTNTGTIALLNESSTNLVMSSTSGGSEMFYRVRIPLNYYDTIRFRIRRRNMFNQDPDVDGTHAILDNIVASYPPMTAVLENYGQDYDEDLKGIDVLGCSGDFNQPVFSFCQTGIVARAWYRFVTNDATTISTALTSPKIINPRLVYRWRYLNQVISPWQEILFDKTSISTLDASLENSSSNLVGAASLPLNQGVGDIEYFFTAEIDAPYFSSRDYATDYVGYGAGWTEKISAVTNRANYKFETPAGGHDYFVRIREAESPFEYVKLFMSVTTNKHAHASGEQAAATNELFKSESVRMELVGTNTWRYCYYVPTNAVGETLKFHFEGRKLLKDPENEFRYNSQDVIWKCDLSELPYMPYTSVAGTNFDNEVSVTLDDQSTHLIIEFNDDALAYSVSHGTYQNFNMWTDALNGYRGNAPYNEENPTNNATSTGVSDAKKKFEADMAEYQPQGYENDLWTENFDFEIANTSSASARVINTPFDTATTALNAWDAGHGQWIRGSRDQQSKLNEKDQIALQLEGRGQGYVALDKSESSMPQGIDTVSFKARIAQTPRFSDFAVYDYGNSLKNYAVSAKVTMSRMWASNLNPPDISPANPSVSLIAYHRANKGCYEFRMTRTASTTLKCELYKWTPEPGKGLVAKCLTSSTRTSAGGKSLLVSPTGGDDVNKWTFAYIFVLSSSDGNKNSIRCVLAKERNAKLSIAADSANLEQVLEYEDSDSPLKNGTYGIGSVDCNASFANITLHDPVNEYNVEAGIDYRDTQTRPTMQVSEGSDGDMDEEWSFNEERWRNRNSTEVTYGKRWLSAVEPANQTIRLQFKDEKNGWHDSGLETNVTSYAATNYVFTPRVSESYKVRLITGGSTTDETRTDVVVDDVSVTSWRAPDYLSLSSSTSGAEPGKWVYMSGTAESAFEIKGDGGLEPEVVSDGRGGFVLKFTKSGSYTFTPSMDIEVDRVLVVGGGGGGGWAYGKGGLGGEVKEDVSGEDPYVLEKGKTFSVTVGAGGTNYYAKTSNSASYRDGAAGGISRISFVDNVTKKTHNIQANGGAGGAKGDGSTVSSDPDGSDGTFSDITGVNLAYGSTGGAGGGGIGGGGAGNGIGEQASHRPDDVDGAAGMGGGGGGGGTGNDEAYSGGMGGSGCVILRMRNSSSVITLQPTRGCKEENTYYACGMRSPYLADGMSMFSFSYKNATNSTVLLLQASKTTEKGGSIDNEYSMTKKITSVDPAIEENWETIDTFTFTNCTPKELISGTRSSYISLRSPEHGFLRLVVAPEVMQHCLTNKTVIAQDSDYGKITITGISCYNEPPLDMRSWWGWNLHTEGWNTDTKEYAYLFDSPEGLSASLNFSPKESDNKSVDARGIGLMKDMDPKLYENNNSFVQTPPLTNGIGTVSFRARTFHPEQSDKGTFVPSFVTLYGSSKPDANQINVPEEWTRIQTFVITNHTYQSYKWSTTDETTKFFSMRLEVNGSRLERSVAKSKSDFDKWEMPVADAENPSEGPNLLPIQRVWLDEIMASEPIAPRIAFRNVRPFRSGLSETVNPQPIKASAITSVNEQPIFGESWGIQVTVEPQQMSDELVTTSVVVYAAFKRGIKPWGYKNWSNEVTAVQLERVGDGLTFRSTYNNAATVIGPDLTPSSTFPDNVWQYYVWAEYTDKSNVKHSRRLDSTDWTPPTWYYGIGNLNEKYGFNVSDNFSAYTIIDSISPNRAWFNEINLCDDGNAGDDRYNYTNQFIEVAIPQSADITDWRIDVVGKGVKRGTIVSFGSADAKITKKDGNVPGVDNTNHYTFVALRSPMAKEVNAIAEADGSWRTEALSVMNTNFINEASQVTSMMNKKGQLQYFQPWGFQLVRPSGIIEHQIVVEGQNFYEQPPDQPRHAFEYLGSGTNFLADIKKIDGNESHWFFAGKDNTPGTLGVFRSHGEALAKPDNDKTDCWTNQMLQTAGKINRFGENGKFTQSIDPEWFLQPLGTNVWIYASVIGSHIRQKLGIYTNAVTTVIIRKGDSTNIVYTTDAWYQIADARVDGVVVPGSQGAASQRTGHTYTLHLNNVTNNAVNVVATEEADSIVGVPTTDLYYDAIMAWLTAKGSDESGIHHAEYHGLGDWESSFVKELDIKDMYFLNIDPTTPGWAFKSGMCGISPVSGAEEGGSVGSLTNVRVKVSMVITNTLTHEAHSPDRIQGYEVGSSSYDYTGTPNWLAANFKICGALQKEGVRNNYYPLRWFVFGPNSFDENHEAIIDIHDPHSKSSPGYYNGWSKEEYRTLPIFYKWKLNEDPVYHDTVEMLKADSTFEW